MVKGKTKSGIKFQIDERIKEDARFLYYLNKLGKPSDDLQETSSTLMGMIELIFGKDEGAINFMNEVANAHGGICSGENMFAELREILEKVNAKNSLPSPK